MRKDLTMPKPPWTRGEVIAVISIIVALISIGLSLTQPEVRRFFHLPQVALIPIAQPTPTPKQSSATSSTPHPTSIPISHSSSMVFDNFNNDIGGWGIIGNDVSYAQDTGNGFIRFNPPDQGPAEAFKQVSSATLSKFSGITLLINLHGATLVAPSDDPNYQTASALYLDQNGWKMVGLYDYVKNSYNGWQKVYIPLTDFKGFDKTVSLSRLGFRFWLHKAGMIDIDDITFVS